MFGSFLIERCFHAWKPSNWILACTDSGCYVKFRSYLNCRFPDDRPQVVWFGWDEIASVKRDTIVKRFTDLSGDRLQTKETCLLLQLNVATGLDPLHGALDGERRRLTGGRVFHDYPVSVNNSGALVVLVPGTSPSSAAGLRAISRRLNTPSPVTRHS